MTDEEIIEMRVANAALGSTVPLDVLLLLARADQVKVTFNAISDAIVELLPSEGMALKLAWQDKIQELSGVSYEMAHEYIDRWNLWKLVSSVEIEGVTEVTKVTPTTNETPLPDWFDSCKNPEDV